MPVMPLSGPARDYVSANRRNDAQLVGPYGPGEALLELVRRQRAEEQAKQGAATQVEPGTR